MLSAWDGGRSCAFVVFAVGDVQLCGKGLGQLEGLGPADDHLAE